MKPKYVRGLKGLRNLMMCELAEQSYLRIRIDSRMAGRELKYSWKKETLRESKKYEPNHKLTKYTSKG